jgi:hypothetical protein
MPSIELAVVGSPAGQGTVTVAPRDFISFFRAKKNQQEAFGCRAGCLDWEGEKGCQTKYRDDPERLNGILTSIFSSIMFMMLTPYFFYPDGKKRLETDDDHRALVKHFTEMFYSMI